MSGVGVSIIIPGWRASKTIASTLKSIYEQFWIVDGGEYEVLIGIDACYDTLKTALNAANDKTTVFWFADHCYPYKIRNTLAYKAKYENILFFDADDKANRDLIKDSLENSGDVIRYKYKYPGGASGITYGILFIKSDLFKKYGGYMPWKCDADANLIHRIEADGVTFGKLYGKDYVLRGRHENQLTVMNSTSMVSSQRRLYKTETEKQIKTGQLVIDPAFAECERIENMDNVKSRPEAFSACETWVKDYGLNYADNKKVIACAAWKAGCAYREASMSYVVKQFEAAEIPVYLGTSDGKYFNRGAARNAAVKQGLEDRPDTEIIILFDTDTHVDFKQLWVAVYMAAVTGNVVYAFDKWCKTNPVSAKKFLAGQTTTPAIDEKLSGSVGGTMAIPVSLWSKFGGYDERFKSWGGEDRALFYVCAALTGKQQYTTVAGKAIHLWHPVSEERDHTIPQFNFNLKHALRYKLAAGIKEKDFISSSVDGGGFVTPDIDNLYSILKEDGGPLSGATAKGRLCTSDEKKMVDMLKYKKKSGKILFVIDGSDVHKRILEDSRNWEQI